MEESTENNHRYEIEIQGQMSEKRARAFPGLAIRLTPEGHTIISGEAMDQSALFGVLLRIRDIGAPLLSVARRDIKKVDERKHKAPKE